MEKEIQKIVRNVMTEVEAKTHEIETSTGIERFATRTGYKRLR